MRAHWLHRVLATLADLGLRSLDSSTITRAETLVASQYKQIGRFAVQRWRSGVGQGVYRLGGGDAPESFKRRSKSTEPVFADKDTMAMSARRLAKPIGRYSGGGVADTVGGGNMMTRNLKGVDATMRRRMRLSPERQVHLSKLAVPKKQY